MLSSTIGPQHNASEHVYNCYKPPEMQHLKDAPSVQTDVKAPPIKADLLPSALEKALSLPPNYSAGLVRKPEMFSFLPPALRAT